LLALHRAGHAAADTWLTDHFTHLGRHGTVDLVAEYLDGEILDGHMRAAPAPRRTDQLPGRQPGRASS
jgi:hypothetical protein